MCILYSSVRTVLDLITLLDFLFLLLSRGFPVRHTELIINFLTRCSFTASLNEKFFGADKFRIGRTLVFC